MIVVDVRGGKFSDCIKFLKMLQLMIFFHHYRASDIFTPSVSEFDPNLDELWEEEYLGPNGN